MPKLLADEGYSTAFFCGSERGSMGFDAYAVSAGFERCLRMEDYEAGYSDDAFDGYWGIWDHRFFDYMGYEIGQMKEPFLASIFTISSHHPFVTPERLKDSLPKGHTLMQPCAAYLDIAIEQFFADNSGKEWFDNTIFVFVADHVSCEHYAERTNSSPGDFHIIGTMYTPDGSLKGECLEPVSQIDIMPTLLGVLGYDASYFAYGRDVFAADGQPVTIVYDNGVYKAFTTEHIHIFRDGAVREVYAIDDIGSQNNLIQTDYSSDVERLIKAYVQQYYEHAERKSYVVPDSLLPADENR
jgi:phosphoglycerol transferase MdoB-like AlkP superfamily enzyme